MKEYKGQPRNGESVRRAATMLFTSTACGHCGRIVKHELISRTEAQCTSCGQVKIR